MTRLYDAEPDEIAVDIATLGLELPIPLDATTGVMAGRLRAQHYHRTSRAVSMADCVLAAAARSAASRWRRPIRTCLASVTTLQSVETGLRPDSKPRSKSGLTPLLVASLVDFSVRKVATLVSITVDPSMSLRDVKNRLSEVVDQVGREHDRVVITKHGRRAAVVVSIDDLESLEETLDVMGRPKLLAQIRDSLAESQNGDVKILSKDQALALLNG